MAGTLKTNAVQLGDSATATQNLTLRTNADGTFTIARGNVGATTQDILTIDANGIISQPQSVVAFSVNSSSPLTINGYTLVPFATKEFDTRSRFNNTAAVVNGIPAYAFMPDVPGYYQLNGAVRTPGSAEVAAAFWKNGSVYKIGTDVTASGSDMSVSSLVYLNGTTDYIAFYAYSGTSVVGGGGAGPQTCWFNGILIAKA